MAVHLEDMTTGAAPLTAPSPTQRFHLEPSPRRVRVIFGGETIAESDHVLLLLEHRRLPVFYFPLQDVRAATLERTDHTTESDFKGVATYWAVRAGDRLAENAAWSYDIPRPDGPDLSGYVAFYWNEMDAWYEEEEERAFAHARNPYKLIDTRQSSRHLRIEHAGEILAETHRPQLIFESGLPVRYYIATEDVRMELLEPSQTRSQCAYKGEASYWSLRVGEQVYPDVAWYYPEPLTLVKPVAGLIAFFQERVDKVFVDGEQIERPSTPWAR